MADFFAAFFTGAAFAADFFAATGAAAFFAASLFRNAATMLALPAALSLRFGFAGSGVAGDDGDSVVPLIAAHRFCCPRAIRRRAAAETLRFVERFRRGGRLRAATRQHRLEVCYLDVDRVFLLLETSDGGVDYF